LDWNSSQILDEMESQSQVVTALDGIYAMSTHTHIMNFSSNITILDDFFTYVNKNRYMVPMDGAMIYDRISKLSRIKLTELQTAKKLILTIENDNQEEIRDAHYELYLDPTIALKGVESEIYGVKTKLRKINPGRYTLIVESLKPISQMVLFVNYDKIY
jgi:hypothetical protein